MKEGTRYGIWVGVLLYSLFAAVYLSVAFPKPSKPKPVRTWAAPHTLVSDSILYGFVRELLSQSTADHRALREAQKTQFCISNVLLENDIKLRAKDRKDRYRFYYASIELGSKVLMELCEKQKFLSEDDTVFIRQQMTTSKGFGLDQRFLPGQIVVPADTVWNLEEHVQGSRWAAMRVLQKRHNTFKFSYIGMPLFSRNGHTVIIAINTTCGGGDCGSGQTWVLQRRQGKWHKVLLLESWDS